MALDTRAAEQGVRLERTTWMKGRRREETGSVEETGSALET
jgi:hypothetical protein